MTEDAIQKSADQILEEIFSTLVSDPVTKAAIPSDSSTLPSNESPTSKADTSKCHKWNKIKCQNSPRSFLI